MEIDQEDVKSIALKDIMIEYMDCGNIPDYRHRENEEYQGVIMS